MPHSNPLDPESPNYKPPLLPNFTSVATQKNVVWFGSSGGGLVTFDGFKWGIYTRADGLPDDHIEAVVTQGDNIWFTVSGLKQQIFKFDGMKVRGYSGPIIESLSANENYIWIGSENEIGSYDSGKDSLVWYQLPAGGNVAALLWDGVSVWVAIRYPAGKSESVEISRFSPQAVNWESEGYFPLVDGETLLAIALDGDILWGGTSRGDVKQFQLSQKAALRTQAGISPPGAWKTDGCIAADESFVWFGYGNRGLIKYDKISGKRESFFDGDNVYGIAVTAEYAWSVTSTGAHRYEKKSGIWTQFKYPKFDVEEQ